MKETITLRLLARPDRSLYWELKVRSEVRPIVKKVGILEFERANQASKLGILGGALAELLCEEYGDTLEPSAVAMGTEDAYREILTDLHIEGIGDEPARNTARILPATRVARGRGRAGPLPH